MSTNSTTSELRMYLIQETPVAVKVTNRPALVDGQARLIEWLPRSLIAYARKEPAAAPGEAQPYTFTLPDWKIEQSNLWNYVES
jgi:hypothetical protein